MIRLIVLKIISLYRIISGVLAGGVHALTGISAGCRFTPTCSEYTYQAVDSFGAIKGLMLGLRRVIRCHPFSEGGFDPPDTRKM
ncbi:MAG: membrane protein insertion efficiency factor YidD [Elusimicrobia bacterium]|nr:membrane protein insertion efficiency factor YidD [Elusimicrobiota bacterium]